MKGHVICRIINSDPAESALQIFAEMERSILESSFRLAEAAGVEHGGGIPPKDERVEALRDLLKAAASGSFAEYWVEAVGAERYDSRPPERHVGVGTHSNVWKGRIKRWAEGIRDDYGVDAPDRELADRACRAVYGVGLEQYENEVVNLNESEEIERVTAGNFRAAKRLIDAVTADLEAGDAGGG
jgi:hypothetical protein